MKGMETNADLNRAVEAMLDFFAAAVEGKDDDDVVCLEAEVNALADACGVEHVEIAPTTAGEVRERIRRGKAELARSATPSTEDGESPDA